MNDTRGPILSVTDLWIAFGGLVAVRNASFEVKRGTITSIIGPNGAGKSTLFNLISGVLSPASGRIVFNGKDVTGWSSHKISRAGLARSFQITNLFGDLNVLENLRLGAQALDIKAKAFMPIVHKKRALEKAEELLERFALTNKAYELAGTLSHGDQRRLEIAVALASEPELLLLDEPTQGMSHGDTVEIAELIRKTARDITVLLIEHDIDMVMDLSDWVVVMHLGAKLSEGAPETVRADSAVRKAYLGEA